MSLKNTKKNWIDDYFARRTHEDEHSNIMEAKAHVGVRDRLMSTAIWKEDGNRHENDDFFATLETAPRQATHATITKENTAPALICASRIPISTVILTEDRKTDKIDDFFETLESVCRNANYAVRDLFGAASSTKMEFFDDIFLNPTYEMIEENRNVTLPSTSAVIQEEEWTTGSHFSSTQMSLLEQNENIFGLSLCEYANFEIGTSGTYGWEVDPFSGVSRLYRTVQHAFEIGESGEGIVLDSSSNAEYKPITGDDIGELLATDENLLSTEDRFVYPDCPEFKVHIATREDYRKVKCDFCEKRFRKAYDLKLHIRSHTGERPYKCSVCEKRFKDPSTLRKHQRIHSGEDIMLDSSTNADYKPAIGDDIGELLATGENLLSTEDRFVCADCPAVFENLAEFKVHIGTHEDYRNFKCDFCEKRFRKAYDLGLHIRSHTGERPYKCSVCEKRFKDPSTLRKHQRIHSDDAFKCFHCSKKFASKYHVQRHEITHFDRAMTANDVRQYAAYDRRIHGSM